MTQPMSDVRHVVFCPSWPGALVNVCSAQEADGFVLLRLVPHHQYETVAVFERITEDIR